MAKRKIQSVKRRVATLATTINVSEPIPDGVPTILIDEEVIKLSPKRKAKKIERFNGQT